MTGHEVEREVESELAGDADKVRRVEKAMRAALLAGEKAPAVRWKSRAIATYHANVSRGVATLSVRIAGREICRVRTNGAFPVVESGRNDETRALWREHFPKGARPAWSDPAVKELLRDASMKLAYRPEARAEAALLRALVARGKSGAPLANIRPVTLPTKDGYPLQVPVPVGTKRGDRVGHIDILARTGHGPNSRICVIEIKAEGNRGVGLGQGLRYAAALRFMMQEPGSAVWELAGLNKQPRTRVPKAVVVAVVPERLETAARNQLDELNRDPAAGIERIRLCTYVPDTSLDRPLKIKWVA